MTATAGPRPLGSGGPLISALGLGTWAIGGPWQRGWGAQDDADSIAAIHRAVDHGLTWIDTAPVYGHGHAETVVARAMAGLTPAERPYIFTKCGRLQVGDTVRSVGEAESLRQECQASLARLGVENLDLLQLHWPPEDGTTIEQAWTTLAELRDAGHARQIGVSNVSLTQLRSLEAIAHVDTLQPPLSLINRGALDELLPWCQAHGTGIIVYSPMQAGLLTGAFDHARVEGLDADDWRRASPDFTEPRLSRNLALVDRLRTIAADARATPAELAIAWALDQPGVSGAIVGARGPRQVDGWIGARQVEMTDDMRAAISQAVADTGV